MLYNYEVMNLVGHIIMKYVIKKHKEYSTTRYQNCLYMMKNKKSYEVTNLQGKNVISPPPPPPHP